MGIEYKLDTSELIKGLRDISNKVATYAEAELHAVAVTELHDAIQEELYFALMQVGIFFEREGLPK